MNSGDGAITVSICQYDGGEKKIQISRYYRDKWTKLGRMNRVEARFVADAVNDFLLILEAATNESSKVSKV
jgi:hypothetical protein